MQHRSAAAWPQRLKAAVIVLVGVAASLTACEYDLVSCETSVFDEVPAPGAARKAIVFARDCGATTSGATSVAIYAINDSIETVREPTIFSARNRAAVHVRWLSDTDLLIDNGDGAKPRIAERKVERRGGTVITIHYSQTWPEEPDS